MSKKYKVDDPSVRDEGIPLQDIPDVASPVFSEDGTNTESQSFFHELRSNKTTRLNFLLSVCLSLVYLILGWSKSQIGPAFLDLMRISGVNLEMGSWFMTSYFFGRLIGSTIGGHLYTKMNHHFMFAVSISVNGLVLAVIPWCAYYELMVAAHVLNGILEGGMNLTLTSKAVSVWGSTPRGRSYIQIMYAVFAISGILAPMATAPFLLSNSSREPNMTSWTSELHSSREPNMTSLINGSNVSRELGRTSWTHVSNSSKEPNMTLWISGSNSSKELGRTSWTHVSNSSKQPIMTAWAGISNLPSKPHMTMWKNQITSGMNDVSTNDIVDYNDTSRKVIIPAENTSRLYIAYSISASLSLLSSVPFVVLFLRSKRGVVTNLENVKQVYFGNLSLMIKRLQLLNIGIFSAVFGVIGQTLGNFITVFCVQHLKWTKVSGAMMTSFYVFATLVGNMAGIFLVRHLKPHTVLLLSTITYTVGFAGLTLCASLYEDAGIWVSVCVIGVPFGMVWPTFISWTNGNFIPVSGYITSYLLVTSHVATMLHPLTISYLMEEVSLLWFCYLCTLEGCISILSVLMMVIYTKFS